MTITRMGVAARMAGLGLAAAAAIGYFSVGAADADTFVPLPDEHITQTLDDGTVVTVSITGQSANINPSMGATPLHRNVWTSGTAAVDLAGGGAGGKDTKTKLVPGYVVGCQVDLSSGATSGVEADATESDSSVTPTGTGSETLTLAAGEAKTEYILDLESPDDYNHESHSAYQAVPGPHQSVTWNNETFMINGCGGYAQARAFATARVYTKHGLSYVTVWGKPFSI